MIDYHIHSTYSIDGLSPLHLYVGTAQRFCLGEIGFAEHVDLNPCLGGYKFLDYGSYAASVEKLRIDAPLQIRCGLEVSYESHLESSIKNFIEDAKCDFVIGSIHEINNITMDSTFLKQSNPLDYFREVERLITSSTFDIVGHLEYFKRWGGLYSPSEFRKGISGVLHLIIDHDIALEVNTSGLRHPIQDTYPSFEVIQWYRELGGELISLGSDAHSVKDMAFQFTPVIKKLKSHGFDTVATFNRRSLELVEL
ncbi:MAG: histidinol-phosphatase HisJ family protein [Theionarchaea archaeon]|nr:histidinol-phosphatase HisJ family protein [Theionarchaea archaeon]